MSQTGIHPDDLLVEFEGHGWLFDGRRLEPNGETATPEEMLERLTERLPMDGLSFSIISLETDEVDGYSVWAAVVNGNQPLLVSHPTALANGSIPFARAWVAPEGE